MSAYEGMVKEVQIATRYDGFLTELERMFPGVARPDILAEIAKLKEQTTWKPIDDEAKNGQSRLLLCRDHNVREGYWKVVPGEADDDWTGWITPDRLLDPDQVTHYMPLPALLGGGQ